MGEISDALARASGEERQQASREESPRRAQSPRPSPGSDARDLIGARARAESSAAAEQVRPPAPPPELPPTPAPTQPQPPPELRHPIPLGDGPDRVARICAVDPHGSTAVRFRHVAVRMRGRLDAARDPSVLVTSALPGEGKTTVALNLAVALASIAPRCRIALVDLDLRRGRIAHILGYEAKVGIEQVLSGGLEVDQVAVPTDVGRLEFLPTTSHVSDAHRLLGGFVGSLMRQLHSRYDYVVCDGPPVLPVPDVPLIMPHVGGTLAVAASGRTRHKAFREMMDLLKGGSMFGVFLNESPSRGAADHYAYGAYGLREPAVEEVPEEPAEAAADESDGFDELASATERAAIEEVRRA